MGWWITLAVLVGLAILPLGVSVKYNADGVWLAIVAGPVRIRILPVKKKEKKPKLILSMGGSSSRLDRPKVRRKASVVLYWIGRPGTFRRPASSMSFLLMSAEME